MAAVLRNRNLVRHFQSGALGRRTPTARVVDRQLVEQPNRKSQARVEQIDYNNMFGSLIGGDTGFMALSERDTPAGIPLLALPVDLPLACLYC